MILFVLIMGSWEFYKLRTDWDKHVTQSIASWETLCIVWIRGLKHGGVVYYEDLRDNTARELIRITNLLGIQLINHNRLNCVLRHNRKNAIQRRYKPRFLEYVNYADINSNIYLFRCTF